jgi:hypothetical protein
MNVAGVDVKKSHAKEAEKGSFIARIISLMTEHQKSLPIACHRCFEETASIHNKSKKITKH